MERLKAKVELLLTEVTLETLNPKLGRQNIEPDVNRGVVVTEAGSYLRLIDSWFTQLKAQGPLRTCNESKEEEEEESLNPKLGRQNTEPGLVFKAQRLLCRST